MTIKRRRRTPEDRETEAAYAVSRASVYARSKGRCEGCGRRLTMASMHFHHRLPRQPLRDDRPINGLGLCLWCHDRCHAYPMVARELGWIVRRGQVPEDVMVLPWPNAHELRTMRYT